MARIKIDDLSVSKELGRDEQQGIFGGYLSIELENAMISNYSVSSGGDRPTESLALNFTKITYNNTSMGG